MTFRLDTNLADLPLPILNQLSSYLNQNDIWMKVLDSDKKNAFYSSPDELDKVARMSSPAAAVLQRWGNRGQSVQSLIIRLQGLSISQGLGVTFDRPQLVLRRKFKAIRWAKEEKPVRIRSIDESHEISIEAFAVGFPSPQFTWYKGSDLIDVSGNTLRLEKCKCAATSSYTCKAWNEVEDGHPFSEFYRDGIKVFSSEVVSGPIDISSYVQDSHACENCKAAEMERVREKLGATKIEPPPEKAPSEKTAEATEKFVAADKVALIISNCIYDHLPPLITPHSDAETLAQSLQELQFKTVTLADLTLSEMKFMVAEYTKLLGRDVYAVLYFAGHGFEVNGQCYLLPVDAPADTHSPEHSICLDMILSILNASEPALHLVLLDVCRKFIPPEQVILFSHDAAWWKSRHKPNRNTVYGYSTLGGMSSYEVKGEQNGVFMKYLKNHIHEEVFAPEMLQAVFRDIENDPRVKDVQIPEVKYSITKKRALTDELVCDGHTASFDQHNVHWTLMHELPMPVYVRFEELQLMATIWFDFVGHFTNKVYVFSAVEEMDGEDGSSEGREWAARHRAYLTFPQELSVSNNRSLTDDEEGVSIGVLLSGLQRVKGELECTVMLRDVTSGQAVGVKDTVLGDVLITKIQSHLRRM